MKLRALAPAKVNLCLLLGPLRSDGRHEILTVFESLSLADSVSMTVAGEQDVVICPGVDGPNLADAALAALRARGWGAPPVRVEIEKRIPVAAGMAGGSADAAAVLRLAAELAPGRPEEIAAIAAELGADVPSQLTPGVVLGAGAGDQVQPLATLAAHAFVIVPSNTGLATADVYREADRLGLPRSADALDAARVALERAYRPGGRPAREHLVNDLQDAALSLCPELRGVLEDVRQAGADAVLVCGSGPTVAGILWGPDGLQRATSAARALSPRHPGPVVAEPVCPPFGLPEPVVAVRHNPRG